MAAAARPEAQAPPRSEVEAVNEPEAPEAPAAPELGPAPAAAPARTARVEFGLRVPPVRGQAGPTYPRGTIESVLRGVFGPRTRLLRVKGPTAGMLRFLTAHGFPVQRRHGEWFTGQEKLVRVEVEIYEGDVIGGTLRLPATVVPLQGVSRSTVTAAAARPRPESRSRARGRP